jgi:hypothetical protein
MATLPEQDQQQKMIAAVAGVVDERVISAGSFNRQGLLPARTVDGR